MEEIVLAHEGRNAVILMHWTDGSSPNYAANPVKLVFYVTDPAALADRIRAEGLEITREPQALPDLGGTIVCLAKDPDGYVIELLKPPAPAEASAQTR
jgi:predicted enzyme related to lactoylglutathione lyase